MACRQIGVQLARHTDPVPPAWQPLQIATLCLAAAAAVAGVIALAQFVAPVGAAPAEADETAVTAAQVAASASP